MKQPDLFGARPVGHDASDKRKLRRTPNHRVEKGGLVNGMTKAALRRYAPAKLPKVTL